MKKLYEKNEVTFAVVWIVIYCVIIGSLRGNFGDGSPWPMLGLAVLASLTALFISKNGLEKKYGLTGWPADQKRYLYFIPMWIIVTGNLWAGIHANYSGSALVFAVLSMALVGYLEEVIFRGFLFRAMLKDGNTKAAVIVTAATFGFGHIVNLFAGQASMETFVQIPFAIAWGFIFTFVVWKSGSLLPCILAHGLIDIFANFSVEAPITAWGYVIATIVISLVYCIYLSRLDTKKTE